MCGIFFLNDSLFVLFKRNVAVMNIPSSEVSSHSANTVVHYKHPQGRNDGPRYVESQH